MLRIESHRRRVVAPLLLSFLIAPLGRAWAEDCNENGIPDDEDLANCDGSAWCSDCNGNGIPDECDIASGESEDCNDNGYPDECELASPGLLFGDPQVHETEEHQERTERHEHDLVLTHQDVVNPCF